MIQEEGEFGLPLVWKSGGAEERDSVKQGHLVNRVRVKGTKIISV
jgi:hypothetical protein